MKKGLMFLACGVLLGLVGCGNEEVVPDDPNKGNDNPGTVVGDDGMDFDENDDFEPELLTYSIVGSRWGANPDKPGDYWTPATSVDVKENVFTKQDSYVYTLTLDVKVGDQFKVVKDGSWTVQYGMEDLNWDKCTEGLLPEGDYNNGPSNRTNIEVTHDATIKIDVHPFYVVEDGYTGALVITEVTK